jgi:hypothetical protein
MGAQSGLNGVTLERKFQSLSLDVHSIQLLRLYVSLVDVFHHITQVAIGLFSDI